MRVLTTLKRADHSGGRLEGDKIFVGGDSSYRRVTSVLFALALLAAGCGTRLTDDERAFYAGTGQLSGSTETANGGSGTAGAASGPSVNGTGPTQAGASGNGATGANGAATGPAVVEGGGPTPDAASTSEACAGPSTEVGVTADTITLGGVFQLSGLLPRFAQTGAYGAQAYAEYLNASGGLCGRQVEYIVADDGFDASRNADETSRLVARALSLVGGFSAADGGASDVLAATNVLDLGIATTPDRQRVPGHFPGLSPERPDAVDAGIGTPAPEYRYAVQNGATRAAIVYVSAAAGRYAATFVGNDMRSAGMDVVLELEVSPTQFSYASTARAIADSGAQFVICLLEINGSVQLAEELSRIDSDVVFPYYRLAYDQRFLDQAGAAAEGAVNFVEFVPFEEQGTNEALDRFLTYFDQVAPGASPTFQAIQGWVAMELYAQVIRSLPGPITRDGLLAAAASLGQVQSGGLYEPFNFGSRERPSCKVVVRVVNGRYQRESPATGFIC